MLLNELFLPKRHKTIEKIAKKHNISYEKIAAQLKKGIKIEREHKEDNAVARQIALDHLEEVPDYYDKLATCVEESNISA